MAILIAVNLAWPLVHQQLVLRYHINPWKLGGWAMYTTIKPRGMIAVVGVTRNAKRVSLDFGKSLELIEAKKAFMARRLTLGLLSDPKPLGVALASAYPQLVGWHVIVKVVGLTTNDTIEVTHKTMYTFERSATDIRLTNESTGPVDPAS